MTPEEHTQFQQLFDIAIRGLAAQGWQRAVSLSCAYGGKVCQYRAEDGKKCFVGHLIPEDKYHPSLEGAMITDVPIIGIGLVPENSTLARLLRDCQAIHDQGFSVDTLEQRYKTFATQHRFTWPLEESPA